MKKTTSLKLSKRLAKYGALTVAIAGVADANGQITYTDVDPDFAGGIGSEFLLDLDNNGTNDFAIRHNGSNSLFLYPLTASNDFIGSGSATYAYPYALNSGVAISSAASGSWLNNGFSAGNASMNYGSSSSSSVYTCSFGNWCSVTDRFLGLRFNIGGNTHYGWARLDVDAVGTVWSVKDFAYNQTPDEAINAGQQTLSIENVGLNELRIVALNKSIGLYNLPETVNYKLFSMTGKLVLDGAASNSTHVIEANRLSSGVYIIEITDANSKAVIRKKIIL